MNVEQLEEVLRSLKIKLAPSQTPTAAEFHEMVFATRNVDSQMMFDYFEGKLDTAESQELEEHASNSQLFLESLVGIGELVLKNKR